MRFPGMSCRPPSVFCSLNQGGTRLFCKVQHRQLFFMVTSTGMHWITWEVKSFIYKYGLGNCYVIDMVSLGLYTVMNMYVFRFWVHV